MSNLRLNHHLLSAGWTASPKTALLLAVVCCASLWPAARAVAREEATPAPSIAQQFGALKFRNVGPFRGGRANAVTGVPGDELTYFFGSTGGGIWKTEDAGITWKNVSDGHIKSGSVGALAVSQSDPNVIYAGMGEHAVRGVMTSHGDGVYRSTDGGATWTHVGLEASRHISAIRIHPDDPMHVYVAVQGALYGASAERGVYRSVDGGDNWELVLFVNETTGAVDLSMDAGNPRILYAGMWDHMRTPWQIRSGGEGSGIHKSTDGGTTWTKLTGGLPETMGKVAVDVSPANSNIVYANIEADKGGVYRSDNAGRTWKQVNSDRVTVARAWYYIEIFADPCDEDQVYVLNAPMLKSIDGGKTFTPVPNPHSDQHDLWINPENPQNMILANDGGGCISFNGGRSWSAQNNQPTAQFYRVITDNQYPYRIYGGQQDNSTVSIASRSRRGAIGERDWFPTAGGESAFLAFDPDDPTLVFGTSIQGILSRHNTETDENKSVVVYPQLNLGTLAQDQKYRFNWNGPIAGQYTDSPVLYTGGNVLFRSDDDGQSWTEISPDLTRNEPEKHGDGSFPFTNEAAGGEVYNTISYIAPSPLETGDIWVGTDDGYVHRTTDDGGTWTDITPLGLEESLINAIDVSVHDAGTAFIAVTRYKFDDLSPMAFKTIDGGRSWAAINNGIADGHFIRVVRQDPVNPMILYAGTEGGLYISLDFGAKWHPFQLNLPVCPVTDLTFRNNDLVVATSGRAFWILDDLGPIQQSSGQLDTTQLRLFEPRVTFKYESATSAGASPLAGQNPLPGVIFDYCLPATWTDEMELKLEVLNSAGMLVREITSEKVVDPKKWDGGPGPKIVLPAKAGLNRFHWDLRTNPIPGVRNVFVMGSHNGPRVVPGEYTLRLTTDQEEMGMVETVVQVHSDPRLDASVDSYRRQQQALDQIRSMAEQVHQSVNRVRRVRSQLAVTIGMLKDIEDRTELREQAEAVVAEIKDWEGQLIQVQQKTFQDVINFRNQLNAELLYLANELDTNEPEPTAGCLLRLEELSARWQTSQEQLNAIIEGSLQAFNDSYRQSGLPAVIVPAEDR